MKNTFYEHIFASKFNNLKEQTIPSKHSSPNLKKIECLNSYILKKEVIIKLFLQRKYQAQMVINCIQFLRNGTDYIKLFQEIDGKGTKFIIRKYNCVLFIHKK